MAIFLWSPLEEASDSASEEANTKTLDDDTLSLLGDDRLYDFFSEDEEVNNDDIIIVPNYYLIKLIRRYRTAGV